MHMSDKKVLIVDDDPFWREVLKCILSPIADSIQYSPSYDHAKKKIEESFDLFVINLCLKDDSDYSGVLLIDRLSEMKPYQNKMPCIIVTGKSIAVREKLFDRYNIFELYTKGSHFPMEKFRNTAISILGKKSI